MPLDRFAIMLLLAIATGCASGGRIAGPVAAMDQIASSRVKTDEQGYIIAMAPFHSGLTTEYFVGPGAFGPDKRCPARDGVKGASVGDGELRRDYSIEKSRMILNVVRMYYFGSGKTSSFNPEILEALR